MQFNMKTFIKFLGAIGIVGGLAYGFVVFALPTITYQNTNIQFKRAVIDVASSTGSAGQVFSSTGTSTLWINASAGTGSSGSVATGTAGQFPYYGSSTTTLTPTSSIFILPTSLIGIGTTTPFAKLMIQGGGTANPFSIVTNTPAAASMLTVLTNGNVGIGTSTPSSTLSLPVGGMLTINNTGDQTTNVTRLGLGFTGTSAFISPAWFGSGPGAPMIIGTGSGVNQLVGNHRLTFNTGNNVFNFQVSGTDNTNSLLKIDINGSGGLGASSGGQNIIDVPMNIAQSGTANYRALNLIISEDSLGTGKSQLIFASTVANSSSPFVVSPNGRVGIGTSTPVAMLTIQATSSNPFSIVSSTAAASSMFTVLTNGRVGINSSSPIDTLAIEGGLQVVGGITSTNLYASGQFSAELPHTFLISSSSFNAQKISGSSTRSLGSWPTRLRTFNTLSCFTTSTVGTNYATATVRIGLNNTWTNTVTATSSRNGLSLIPVVALTTNNTFARQLPAFIEIGNVLGSFDWISCTFTDI